MIRDLNTSVLSLLLADQLFVVRITSRVLQKQQLKLFVNGPVSSNRRIDIVKAARRVPTPSSIPSSH